jgi:putative nucleotidyltransferase with HDIG domain
MAKIFTVETDNSLLSDSLHKQVIKEAERSKLGIFVVGGYLRDLVLNTVKPQFQLLSKDVDYAIAGGSAFEFARKMADILKGHFVPLDEKNDTARVVMPDGHNFDFAGCLGGAIEKDILRRDFTINALYVDPRAPSKIIDLTGGIDDIKNGVIKIVEDSVFKSDPLRLLRAFRFAAKLSFDIETRTFELIQEYRDLIKAVAGERISYELFLIFGAYPSASILKNLADTGLLEAIFPELIATRSVTKNIYHHLNLFDHSIEAVVQAENAYLEKADIWHRTNLFENFMPGVTNFAVSKLAALLHDIGKPNTWVITEEGKHTFIGHERIGAQMIPAIAKRLRWSNTIENIVTMLVDLHLRPGQLFHNTPATAKGINRLYRQIGKNFPALILLALGDLSATQGPQMTDEKSSFLREKFYWLLSDFEEYCANVKGIQKLLDGNEIMKLLDIAPGKKLGDILDALQEAQELKEVANRSQAIEFVQSWHKSKE